MNQTEVDNKWMTEAITLSTVCAPSDKAIPKVGAVISDSEWNLISSARCSNTGHRGDHAEPKALALVPDRRKLPAHLRRNQPAGLVTLIGLQIMAKHNRSALPRGSVRR